MSRGLTLDAGFLRAPEVSLMSYDPETAFAVGRWCARSEHADVVDVHVALHASLHDHVVVTSDPDDIATVNPLLDVVVV